MKYTSLFSFFTITLIVVIIAGCTSDPDFRIQEPTFDDVEEKTFDISGIEAEPVQDGITKYIVEEGRGEARVVIRDELSLFVTLRNLNGEFIYSSYQNERTNPDFVQVMSITPRFAQNFQIERSYTNGFRKGLIGMREGEKRVLIVPPSEGFENIQAGSFNEPFRNDTLRYDIELETIF